MAGRLRGLATLPCSIIPICAAACHTTFLTQTILFYDQLRESRSHGCGWAASDALARRDSLRCPPRGAACRINIGANTPEHRVAPPSQMRRNEGEADLPLAAGPVRHIGVQRECYAQPRKIAENRHFVITEAAVYSDRTLEKWRKSVMHPCVGCVTIICGSDAKHRGPATSRIGAGYQTGARGGF